MKRLIWQVGLDIQADYLRAIAVVWRRGGWQLRHWWQYALPNNMLDNGLLCYAQDLTKILLVWRKTLPRVISLRICLPAQRVMQTRFAAPDARLGEPLRGEYIVDRAAKQFPLNLSSLRVDYRQETPGSQQVTVSAARQQEVLQWQDCLAQAGIYPDVMDLAPCVLQAAAAQAGLSANRLLIHQQPDGWLWVAPYQLPFQFGMLEPQAISCPDQLYQHVLALYAQRDDCCSPGYFSSYCAPEQLPAELQSWSIWDAFHQYLPPLPTYAPAFVFAAGLAMRDKDS
jgi:pilus assembly protein HofM